MKAFKTTTAQERATAGKALRKTVPRERHAAFDGSPPDVDPIALLDDLATARLQFLVPLRDDRMVDTAFTYFRGAAVTMAAYLASSPVTGLRVQACGDAHCLNFGGFASPERNVLFDVNDFDETLPGPWEWDLKRLVTSIVIAGRDNGIRRRDIIAAALATAKGYRTRMLALAIMPALDVWYARMDATEILAEARRHVARSRGGTVAEQVATDSIRAAIDKITTGTGRARRFVDDPPALFHSPITERPGFDVEEILRDYPATLSSDVQHLLSRYRLIDYAIKVVGVGSVGTRCAIALFGADDHDEMLLQVKEALPSVLEAHVGASEYANHGERVVRGQRLMQVASDAFLGWASSGRRDYYVRQFKDMKSSANLDGVDAEELLVYGRYCALALAAAHARSGDAAGMAGYMGSSDVLDRAIVEYAEAYADVNERDHAIFAENVSARAKRTA